jgi:hypothetical protein
MTRTASAAKKATPMASEQDIQEGAARMPLSELPGPTTTENPRKPARPSDEEIYFLIQESAYYKAEARGFSPGYEEQDWLEAEAQIKAQLGYGSSERN